MHVSIKTAKRALTGVIVVELVCCLGLGVFLALHKPAAAPRPRTAVSTPLYRMPAPVQTSVVGHPMRLKIPKINVDAALDYVALTPDGALGAPRVPANAGWYDRGPVPGASGNAVIDGHFGWKDGVAAVFDNLHTLQAGDNVYVEDDRGATIAFVVRELRTYGNDANPAEVFRSTDSGVHLNLITCGGKWDAAQKSYSSRLVVFADKQPAV